MIVLKLAISGEMATAYANTATMQERRCSCSRYSQAGL